MRTLGWMFGAWLGLVALQALTSPSAPARVQAAFSDVEGLVTKLVDPNVPAIPDLRTKEKTR